ncbi:MAG: hypothetical protein ACI9DC_003644 [Gammaproteobacteria bacterium]|jgi:hypothetical protein
MSNETSQFEHWDECDGCEFKGRIVFRTRVEEDYEDADALGFVMDSTCPECGCEESVLVVAETYHEMLLLSTTRPAS